MKVLELIHLTLLLGSVAAWTNNAIRHSHRRLTNIPRISNSECYVLFQGRDVQEESESKIVVDYPKKLILLIPAYNEEFRIANTLKSYRDYFQTQQNWYTEILVVDDGSQDGTSKIVSSFQSNTTTIPIHCVSLPVNQGKGAALMKGIQHSIDKTPVDDTGTTLILTMDADGSADLSYLDCFMDSLRALVQDETKFVPSDWSIPAIVTGNRNYNILGFRGILRWGFQTAVSLLTGGLRVQDSQCGYKLMTSSAAKLLYKDLNLQGWSHDVEVLYRAKYYNVPIDEVVIEWNDKDGSKVVESGVVRVSIQMLLDVLRIRWEFSVTGNWIPSE